jgi:hypothetical protein
MLYFDGTNWIEFAGSINSLVYAKSIYQDVRNQSGATIPLGTPVYISGAIGASSKILISPASNASEAASSKTMAITTSAISNNSNGQVISEGLLEGIDTTGATDGDPVWLGVDGAKIYGLANKPAAPAHLVFLGIVVRGGSANTGSIFVKIQNGFELEEIHNVSISSLINGNILAYDSATGLWKNTNTLQSTASTIPLIIKGSTSQTANLQEWQNSAGTILSGINAAGQIHTGTTTSINGSITGAILFATYVSSTVATFEYDGTSLVQVGQRVTIGDPYGNYSSTGFAGTWTVTAVTSNTFTVLGSGFSDYLVFPEAEDGTFTLSAAGSFVANTAVTTPVVVKGVTSQTANLQEWQNSAGTVLSNINNVGAANFVRAGIGGTTPGTTPLFVTSPNASYIATIIRAASGQTANLTEWQNSGGTILARVSSGGAFVTSAVGVFGAQSNTPNAQLYVLSNSITNPTFVAKAVASQTSNLMEWQNSSGTVLGRIDAEGSITSANRIVSPGDFEARSNSFHGNPSFSGATTNITTRATTQIGTIIRGVASQTANLQEWQNSSGTILNSISASGTLNINTSGTGTINLGDGVLAKGPGNGFTLNSDVMVLDGKGVYASVGKFTNSTGTTTVPLTVKAIASQTANLQEWQDSAGTVLSSVSAAGLIRVNNTNADAMITSTGNSTYDAFRFRNASGLVLWGAGGNNNIFMANSGSFSINGGNWSGGRLNVDTGTASTVGAVIRAAASQTANLQEWQDSTGAVLSSISASGGFTIPSLTVSGDFTVNGTTTNINTTNLVVEDKNITIADVSTPTDTTADGAGITIKGATDKTLNWVQSTGSFTSSEPFIINTNSTTKQNLIVKAVASQTANLTEWQNSSGTVLSSIDSSGSFTSVSQPIQVAGSTYGFSQTVATQYGATAYWKIATLPPTTLSTCDQINIEAMLGTWSSTGKTKYEIMMGNRDAFAWKYTKFGENATQVRIQSYTEADGSVSVYVYSENTFTTFAYNITLSAITGSSGVGATIYKNPTASTTAPTGTKSFDTAEPTTYIPLIGMNNAGLLSTKGAIFNPTSVSAVPLIAQGAASQTADLQQWKNSTGTTYLNVTNAGAMISSGGVTISSNPTINAYGAAMKIASGVNTYPMLILQGATSQSADLQQWQNNAGTVIAKVDANGNFSAISKSFDIPHPTKENMRLRYASLEGNEHGVYVRGITKNKVIELPEYWTDLVDESTITVSLTSVGKFQKVYVEKIEGNKIYIGGRVKEISYAIFGERKDIDKLIVEH